MVVAAAAMLLSVVFGISTRRTARKALALSERQEARRDSRIDLYLIGSVDHREPMSNDRVLTFNVTVSNPADRPTSIVQAELHVTYEVEAVLTTVKIRDGVPDGWDSSRAGVEPVVLPFRLEANDARTGWLCFALSGDLMNGRAVDRFDVVVRDVHGIEQSLQVRVLGQSLDG